MSNAFISNEKLAEIRNANGDVEEEKSETIPNGVPHNSSGGDTLVEDSHRSALPTMGTDNYSSGDEAKTLTNSKLALEEHLSEDTLKATDAEEVKEEEWTDLLGTGVIMKKITVEGKPDTRPERGEKCIVNYTCCLEDDTIVETKQNFQLHVGEFDVIQGLDVSIGLMNIGERCTLKIQPRLAYGKLGLPPKIQHDTTLVYNIELVAVEPEVDVDALTIQDRKILGNKKRERGNWWYGRGENGTAVQCYRRALDYLNEVENVGSTADGATDAELQALLEDRVSVCNNMAAAQIKMEAYDQALQSLQAVLACQPENVKAHYRKAKVYIGKNELPIAMRCLIKAKELAPNDADILKEIASVSRMLDRQKQSERELAKRMFSSAVLPQENQKSGKSATTGKKKKTGNDRKGSTMGIWATIGAAAALGVAGYVAYRNKYV